MVPIKRHILDKFISFMWNDRNESVLFALGHFYKKNGTRERYLFALCHSYKIKVEAKGICLLLSVILNKKRCGKVAC